MIVCGRNATTAFLSVCSLASGLSRVDAGNDEGAVLSAKGEGRGKPNILWLTSEDNNVTWIGCYGNAKANTPTLDKLAKEGFQYMEVFSAAPVCAPSRSTWITGINAVSMGTQNMRSRYPIPHDKIKYYPDILRANGYYCANYPKTDYNIGGRDDKACWDNPGPVDWEALKKHQPFFQVINCGMSHESQAKYRLDKTRHSPDDVVLHKYHPDDPTIKKNYARYYDCIENMDGFEAKQLKALEKAGLADNTIVIYCSDHGGVLPRSKRFLFDSGLHSPLIIRIPEKFKYLWPAEKPGTKISRLVSFLDMPKTWLSITGCELPKYMQGRVFLGPDAEPEPEYAFAFRGRMDERIDNQRAIRGKRFLYVKNYMPYVPWGQRLEYMWEMPAYKRWDELFKSGATNAVTGRFFHTKGGDELYDSEKDPDNVDNLISNPEYCDVAKKMRAALRDWQKKIYDAGLMPESEAIRRAKENGTTIYEMTRNPRIYNLDAYLDISDMALERNPENLPALVKALGDDDLVIRYWGLVGCLLVKNALSDADKKKVSSLLDDKSHAVRTMAAFVSVEAGYGVQKALDALDALLKDKSYAMLRVLNTLDWMGDAAKPLMDTVSAINSDERDVRKMCRCLLGKFSIPIPKQLEKRPPPWKKKKQKAGKKKSARGFRGSRSAFAA